MSEDSIEGMFNEFDTEILSRDKEIIKLQSRIEELEGINRELVEALESIAQLNREDAPSKSYWKHFSEEHNAGELAISVSCARRALSKFKKEGVDER